MINNHQPFGPYERYFKRILDFLCGLITVIVFSWLYIIIAILVKANLGSPILFRQKRPGKDGKIFEMYKFRSMSNAKNEDGELLPDTERLTKFGSFLRSISLEGNDIIRQSTKSLENKGFREVSPIIFFNGCNQFSNNFRTMIA